MTDWRLEQAQKGRHYDQDGRPVDLFDRVMLYQPSWFAIALKNFAHPDTLRGYKIVPESHVEEDVEAETWLATIRCTCGETHLLELGQQATFDCRRNFYYTGAPGRLGRRAVLVMRLTEEASADS